MIWLQTPLREDNAIVQHHFIREMGKEVMENYTETKAVAARL